MFHLRHVRDAQEADLDTVNLARREIEIVRRFLVLNLLQILPYADANHDALFVRDALEHLAVKFDI